MVKNGVAQAGARLTCGGCVGDMKIPEKRWNIDLEKRIQEEHFDESYSERYSFNPVSYTHLTLPTSDLV